MITFHRLSNGEYEELGVLDGNDVSGDFPDVIESLVETVPEDKHDELPLIYDGPEIIASSAEGTTAIDHKQIPDNAIRISDRSEAPEGAQIVEGERGGLAYVPEGSAGGDSESTGLSDNLQEQVTELPSEFDGSFDQRFDIKKTAKNVAQDGGGYQETVEAIESQVSDMDADLRETIRSEAYANTSNEVEIGGETIDAPNVLSASGSDLRERSEEQLRERVEGGDVSMDFIEDNFFGWWEAGGTDNTLLNPESADLWTVAAEETGNRNVPDDATATANSSISDEERQDLLDQRENTQEILREVYGDSVTVQRGVSGEFAQEIKEAAENGESVDLDHRTLESWTTNPDVASEFASGDDGDGVVISTEIPIEDVWGASHTTPELEERENELIVGSDGSKSYSPDEIHTPDSESMANLYDEVAG